MPMFQVIVPLLLCLVFQTVTAAAQPTTEETSQRGLSATTQPTTEAAPLPASGDDDIKRFVGQVLADTEDVWGQIFQAAGHRYEKPTLVLFSGLTTTACGMGESAIGPFYCSRDRRV